MVRSSGGTTHPQCIRAKAVGTPAVTVASLLKRGNDQVSWLPHSQPRSLSPNPPALPFPLWLLWGRDACSRCLAPSAALSPGREARQYERDNPLLLKLPVKLLFVFIEKNLAQNIRKHSLFKFPQYFCVLVGF